MADQLSFDLDRLWLRSQKDRYARLAEVALDGQGFPWGVFFWLREQAAPEAKSVWTRLLEGMWSPQQRAWAERS